MIPAIRLAVTNGSSTGMEPKNVNNKKETKKIQKNTLVGLKQNLLKVEVLTKGMIVRMVIDAIIARTPPILDGMERRIAYAKRKYHSGTICVGVVKGLATVKLSASPKMFG